MGGGRGFEWVGGWLGEGGRRRDDGVVKGLDRRGDGCRDAVA